MDSLVTVEGTEAVPALLLLTYEDVADDGLSVVADERPEVPTGEVESSVVEAYVEAVTAPDEMLDVEDGELDNSELEPYIEAEIEADCRPEVAAEDVGSSEPDPYVEAETGPTGEVTVTVTIELTIGDDVTNV